MGDRILRTGENEEGDFRRKTAKPKIIFFLVSVF